MGRGGSSLHVLSLSMNECFSEKSESTALMLCECVIITSMFLYGVVQPGASPAPLTFVSDLVCMSDSLQYKESKLQMESDSNSLCVLKKSSSSQGESTPKSARDS